ncbi:MAG TPA: oxidative damage protection protein [Gammaproteobacteria bacterium]|nr:oxidative damage protection protein [Gammaproteobacteria bacterium]
MTRMVNCPVVGGESPALTYAPYPGELGVRIYNTISQEGWQRWMQHQTMLINEYRLATVDPEARKFLEDEMQKFLFGEGSDKPGGYVAPEK